MSGGDTSPRERNVDDENARSFLFHSGLRKESTFVLEHSSSSTAQARAPLAEQLHGVLAEPDR